MSGSQGRGCIVHPLVRVPAIGVFQHDQSVVQIYSFSVFCVQDGLSWCRSAA